jgi:prophage regulatory protein
VNAPQLARFLRRPEVLKLTGLGKTTVHRLMAAGQFPRSFLVTPRCAAWDERAVLDWMEQRRGRDAPPAPRPTREKWEARP